MLQSYLYGSVLSLVTISVFLRVGFLLKLVLMLAVTTFHLALYGGLQIALLLAVMVTLLHVLDRQIEFTSRTDFLWKAKLKVEQEEVETMRGINKILLENILPAHVAEHFLDKRNSQVQSCSSVRGRPLEFCPRAVTQIYCKY
jgi:adenylate cyclase 2